MLGVPKMLHIQEASVVIVAIQSHAQNFQLHK